MASSSELADCNQLHSSINSQVYYNSIVVFSVKIVYSHKAYKEDSHPHIRSDKIWSSLETFVHSEPLYGAFCLNFLLSDMILVITSWKSLSISIDFRCPGYFKIGARENMMYCNFKDIFILLDAYRSKKNTFWQKNITL